MCLTKLKYFFRFKSPEWLSSQCKRDGVQIPATRGEARGWVGKAREEKTRIGLTVRHKSQRFYPSKPHRGKKKREKDRKKRITFGAFHLFLNFCLGYF